MKLWLHISLLILALSTGSGALAAPSQFPVIQGHGGIQTTEGTNERPNKQLRYQVVFDIAKAAPEAGKVNRSLEKVARFINLLGADGIKARPGDVVAVIHGPATPIVLLDEAYQVRFGSANPSLNLIRALQEAGVEVRVCSQALAGHRIDRSSVSDLVQIDASAMTTLVNLQLRGYALVPE